jgi:twitching motility two-component system response regulator PilH
MATVLVIEDSSFQRKVLSGLLTSEGYDVILAENGKEGIERADQEKPDAIITDLLMPEYDGYWVLEQLRIRKLALPVIVITSDIQNTTESLCRKLGAIAVLHKPVKKEQVISAVRNAVGIS